MITCSGWDPNNEIIIRYIQKGNIFYTPTDTYIREKASLATPFKKVSYPDLQITALPETDDHKRRLDHSDIAGNFGAAYQTPRSSTFNEVDTRFSQIISKFKAC
jgi:hypothetical protein